MTYSNSYAWLEAAKWRGISDGEFIDMDVEDQARVIAHWEQHHKLQAVLSNTKGN